MAMAVPGRLPRVVPGNDVDPLIVDGQVIPAGVSEIVLFLRAGSLPCTFSTIYRQKANLELCQTDGCLYVSIYNAYKCRSMGSGCSILQSRPLAGP